MKSTRRDFIKKAALATTAITVGMSAQSYGNVLGANEMMNVAIIGANSRGQALIQSASVVPNVNIKYVCDVDSRVIDKTLAKLKSIGSQSPQGFKDIRKLLEQKDLDAIMIATPDHWHAPMALMGVQAGKHVYVEKPCSHNAREGELLVEAQKKYPKLIIQMGNQQRSAPTSIQAMKDIQNGIIGEVYFGKAWYTNNRGSIGVGKETAVPDWLDWDLWQGPAPRTKFKDNYVHYNWHWFWNWGTGEINNNGAHEMDICRWALGVDYPVRVSSSGGRYGFQDDWEFYDTQIANFEYEGGKMLTWEGLSCNSFRINQLDRGSSIHGTKGSIVLTRNNYRVFDIQGKMIKEEFEKQVSATTDPVGAGGLDAYHMNNFMNAIRISEKQNSPIAEGHKSVLLCHLGNIAQKLGRTLQTDPQNGRILKDKEALEMWGREYESGWEPKV
ncbi:MAG: Gfo/Idh/MocA family oxidoreductase [Microscillaceae bacterium]|nr:Gfo/Idh/MocA family oxidoreductase [Microscillaceae bacterium]